MLVLSRQRDETIMIGDDIEITVVDIRGDKVRLGINAPTKIAVHRKEVYEAIKAENEQASRIEGTELAAMRPGQPRARTGDALARLAAGAPARPPVPFRIASNGPPGKAAPGVKKVS